MLMGEKFLHVDFFAHKIECRWKKVQYCPWFRVV